MEPGEVIDRFMSAADQWTHVFTWIAAVACLAVVIDLLDSIWLAVQRNALKYLSSIRRGRK